MPDEPKQQVDPYAELANRRLHSPHSYTDRLEYLPALKGREAAEVYREMSEGDALVGAILFAIEMVLRQVPWNVEAATSEEGKSSPEDIRRADFLASCKNDMSHTWEELISDALTMLPFGHAYMEIVYKHRSTNDPMADAEQRTKFPDGGVGWRKFSLVPQETIDSWCLDDHNGVDGIVQGSRYGEARVMVPIEKAVLFRTTSRRYRGISVLRRVVQAWYHRQRIQEIEGIGIERDLAGLPVFTVDVDVLSNPSRKQEYQDIIRNLRRDEQEGVVLPGKSDEGSMEPLAKLELLSTGGSRQFDTNAIVSRYAREIAVALLQDVVLLGHEKVGTQALASEKRDLSDTALQAWLNDIAAVLNTHAVPRLFALNGESLENLPTLAPGELRPTDVEEFASALNEIAGAGFPFTGDPEVEAEIRRRLGLPPRNPDEEAPLEPPPDIPAPAGPNGTMPEEPTEELPVG